MTNAAESGGAFPLREADFKEICKLVYDVAGIHLTDAKRELVQARLAKRLRQLNMCSFDEYLLRLREDRTADELITMLDAISTNLTQFWRESQHFDHLRDEILPTIFQRAERNPDRRLRIWCAGCSTGEEPYGLAIVVHSSAPPALRMDIKILATDLSTRVLAIAKLGRYPAERIKDVPPELRVRYFQPQQNATAETSFQIAPEIRALVSFARLNLMEHWPINGPFDVIFCRNVMIYFDKPTQSRLVNRYFEILRPGGVLYVGHSESLTGIDHKFKYMKPTIYQKP